MTARHFVAQQCNHSPRDGGYRPDKSRTVLSVLVKVCASLLGLMIFAPLVQAQGGIRSEHLMPTAAASTPVAPDQTPESVTCPTPGTQDLLTMPELKSQNGVLRANIAVTDGLRTVWGSHGIKKQGSSTDTRCASQYLRFFVGYDPEHPQPWPAGPEPMPGPTLRARVGDLIEITFQNKINLQHFANSLDQGLLGNTPGCDQVFGAPGWHANTKVRNGSQINPTVNNPGGFVFTATTGGETGATPPKFPQTKGATVQDGTVTWINQAGVDWTANNPYNPGTPIQPVNNNPGGFVFTATGIKRGTTGESGATEPDFPQTEGAWVRDNDVTWTNSGKQVAIYPDGDTMPDCIHGSSTANLHFHGTHTTPSTTGDNVLLYIRPALQMSAGSEPTDAFVEEQFAQIFRTCEKDGSPSRWDQLPRAWRDKQKELLQQYDATAPYKGQPGSLPHSMQLWPSNAAELAQGLWPQYQIGASPYCFRLTKYVPPPKNTNEPPQYLMGQAPGTHWYHAHKHGSTALNVANGMTGAFIIEGQYDDDLHKFYGPQLREQVLMLQQISPAPFPLLNPANTVAPGAARPPISVNGRRQPIVEMRPGEVQLWRIVNGAFRDAVQFVGFVPEGAKEPCNQPGARDVVLPCVNWRQIAQDGVQFDFTNYNRVGAPNNTFDLAPANRADLLVKAPTQPGTYELRARANTGPLIQQCPSPPHECQAAADTSYLFPLLTVKVADGPVSPPMDFIQKESDFPQFPTFLADIPENSIYTKRKLVFGPGNTTINGQAFNPNQINQVMLLNTTEEWKVENQANDKSHPFHIHINPFQVVELFEPNSPEAMTEGNPCYVNPDDPATFKPCPSQQPQAPFVWWDTFAIPTGRQYIITKRCNDPTNADTCPAQLRPYTQCSTATGKPVCTEYIPGWFKMRTRFADFTGDYVLHCHILIHEDRGMMQLIEVVPDKTLYTHH